MAAEPASTSETLNTTLVLTHAPGWLAYVAVLIAILAAWWGWTRYGPSVDGALGVLARGCRSLGLVLIVGLIAGPAWQVQRVHVEPGVLVYAIDQSISMARPDGPNDESRIDAAQRLHTALSQLADQRNIALRTFTIGGTIEAQSASDIPQLEATGLRSSLGEHLVDLAASARPDAMVLLSDGRVTHGSSLEASAQRLAQRGHPDDGVWVLAVGGERVDPQLRIDEIELPSEPPLGERVPLVIRGGGRALDSTTVRARVYRGDELIADELIELPAASEDDPLQAVELAHQVDVVFPDQGEQQVRVLLSSGEQESETTMRVTVNERKLQVLLLLDRPRYEMRYLRDALNRDYTVTVHSYLADGRWRRWGGEEFGGKELPLTPTLIADYDVVLIGDLAAERLTGNQRESIVNAVRDHGTGLVWLPGALGNIAGFRGSNLGKLIPVEIGDAVSVASGYTNNVERRFQPSDAALNAQLLTLDNGDWQSLPLLRTGCPIVSLVPGATILANDQNDNPLVVVRTYGAGRALFIGMDDSWRWRRQVGDRYLHRFWSQLLRYVSNARALGDNRWRIITTPHRAEPGQSVSVAVVPAAAAGDLAGLPATITLQLSERDGNASERLIQAHRPTGESNFTIEIPAPPPGTWTVAVEEGLAGESAAESELIVNQPGDELRGARRDLNALQQLAAVTGGRFFDANAAATAGTDAIQQLTAALPSLSHERQSTQRESLWDRWWVFILTLCLFALDWAIRRWNRLP